jgi:hypothetical protein
MLVTVQVEVFFSGSEALARAVAAHRELVMGTLKSAPLPSEHRPAYSVTIASDTFETPLVRWQHTENGWPRHDCGPQSTSGQGMSAESC